MTANVGSVPTLDAQKHIKTKHIDVPTAALVGTPASATAIAVQTLIAAAVQAVVAAAPGQLDTLDELAAALGDDANFAATVTAALAAKADAASVAATYVHFGPTLPTLPSGTEYVWNKTDGAGTLLDIVSGVA